jgi:hypothetical protein
MAVPAAFGALLFFQSLALLFANRDAFVRPGFPDRARVALAGLEAAAALLLVIPKTFDAGAIGLVGVLAWAAGFSSLPRSTRCRDGWSRPRSWGGRRSRPSGPFFSLSSSTTSDGSVTASELPIWTSFRKCQ